MHSCLNLNRATTLTSLTCWCNRDLVENIVWTKVFTMDVDYESQKTLQWAIVKWSRDVKELPNLSVSIVEFGVSIFLIASEIGSRLSWWEILWNGSCRSTSSLWFTRTSEPSPGSSNLWNRNNDAAPCQPCIQSSQWNMSHMNMQSLFSCCFLVINIEQQSFIAGATLHCKYFIFCCK